LATLGHSSKEPGSQNCSRSWNNYPSPTYVLLPDDPKLQFWVLFSSCLRSDNIHKQSAVTVRSGRPGARVARFYLAQHTKTGKIYPKRPK
jgi:hypothetical protein